MCVTVCVSLHYCWAEQGNKSSAENRWSWVRTIYLSHLYFLKPEKWSSMCPQAEQKKLQDTYRNTSWVVQPPSFSTSGIKQHLIQFFNGTQITWILNVTCFNHDRTVCIYPSLFSFSFFSVYFLTKRFVITHTSLCIFGNGMWRILKQSIIMFSAFVMFEKSASWGFEILFIYRFLYFTSGFIPRFPFSFFLSYILLSFPLFSLSFFHHFLFNWWALTSFFDEFILLFSEYVPPLIPSFT